MFSWFPFTIHVMSVNVKKPICWVHLIICPWLLHEYFFCLTLCNLNWPPPVSLKMGRWKTKKLTAFEIPKLGDKLPFRRRCARCPLQRSKTSGGPAGAPPNIKSSEVLYRLVSKFGTTAFQNLSFFSNFEIFLHFCRSE